MCSPIRVSDPQSSDEDADGGNLCEAINVLQQDLAGNVRHRFSFSDNHILAGLRQNTGT